MESKKGLISIICAVRNDERFLRQTLETVVSQTYPHWELVIMDGASTDGTVGIIKEFAAKYPNIIWRSEPDKGQWDALEKALAMTSGEYLYQLCGQDGYLSKEWFANCVAAMEQHPEVSLVWGVQFNMSEDGKLLGPHYAFSSFLKDKQYGLQTKTLDTIIAKIDWKRPEAGVRLRRLFKKLTWSRFVTLMRSFKKEDMPQKQDFFMYWLKTARAFPEGNMCMRKDVYIKNTVRFPQETMTNRALFDFCYNFNARGYLSYGLPLAASFGRTHAGGQPLLAQDHQFFMEYKKQVADFAEKIKGQKFTFIDPAGNSVSERTINL